MKNSYACMFFLSAIFALTFISCKHSSKDDLVGKWQLSQVHLANVDMQLKMFDTQIQRLQDSVSKNTDTAKLNMFQKKIADVQKRESEFKARQDTAIQKSSWEFKGNGDFVAHQGGQSNNGIWSLDEGRMMLFTVLGRQTNSATVHLDKDTLTLQLDSVNYLKLAKIK